MATPPRVIPCLGQSREYVRKAPVSDGGYVLQENEPWSKNANGPEYAFPDTRPLTVNPRPSPRIRNVLTGKTCRNNVHLTLNGGPVEFCNVSDVACVRITGGQDQRRVRIDLRDDLDPFPGQGLNGPPDPAVSGAQLKNWDVFPL
ncbi:diguanylate cyclase with PAS/PAC and GAF sensors [Streptomyces laurentii]|uniref:Diguanylate cyclase with PAS/PAC and GAF sensors n=1 Tax=Streptomyces laurentii TaxID=39478 RepID=A0A160NYX1_STRLU|nr:diguanylate cyclase with PAS/PAC and GAF sensors [Streptomyces laurentii]